MCLHTCVHIAHVYLCGCAYWVHRCICLHACVHIARVYLCECVHWEHRCVCVFAHICTHAHGYLCVDVRIGCRCLQRTELSDPTRAGGLQPHVSTNSSPLQAQCMPLTTEPSFHSLIKCLEQFWAGIK